MRALDLNVGAYVSLWWFCLPDPGNLSFSLFFFFCIIIILFASKFVNTFLVIKY